MLISYLQKCKNGETDDKENVVGRDNQTTVSPHHLVIGGIAAVLINSGSVNAQDVSPDDVFQMPDRPTLNFYGAPGLIDMPSGDAMPDGQFAVGISNFGGITRTTLSFQATPRLSMSFRYVGIQDWNSNGFETYRDRSFDLRYLLNKESKYLPAVTIGLQDFAGTGIYAGEYIAATKTFSGGRIPGTIKLTGGLGWGRLGSVAGISPNRPSFTPGGDGGKPSYDQWFRGKAAPFGGVEWQVSERFGLKAEVSSDAYIAESVDRAVIERKSRFNFGAEYQASDRIRLGAYYLYGSEFGLNMQVQLNPKQPISPLKLTPAEPIATRPSRASQPQAWTKSWASNPAASTVLRDALIPAMAAEGLTLTNLKVDADTAEVRFRNDRYGATTVAIGRAARALARTLPPSVETFRLVPVVNNLAQSAVVIRRTSLEDLEFAPNSTQSLLAVTDFKEAGPVLPGTVRNETLYPDFSWTLSPYISTSYFDPDEPVRVDGGLKLEARFRPAPGWTIAGQIRHRLGGNISDSARDSNSVLPRVRTNGLRYAQAADTVLQQLYVSKQWKPSDNLYARVSAGYFERMFGGVSAEVLWKPVSSRLAFGVEANYARQRDFDGRLGFQDYGVATGHVSAYYEFGDGYQGQLDVGRYLAGDVGATVTLSREFANGWRVGGFFTLTDVSSEDFGEGSFDKGISLTIPVGWFVGTPGKRTLTSNIRPIQRDGGARLSVPGRLYDQVRSGHRRGLSEQWSGVWE